MGSLGPWRRLGRLRCPALAPDRRRGACGMDLARQTGPRSLQLGLDALHVEPDRCPVGEVEGNMTAGASGLRSGSKLIASSASTAPCPVEVDALHLGAEHPLEAQRRPPAHVLARLAACRPRARRPSRSGCRTAANRLLARQKGEIGDLEHGILQVRRDHRQVVGIERNQLQLWHGAGYLSGRRRRRHVRDSEGGPAMRRRLRSASRGQYRTVSATVTSAPARRYRASPAHDAARSRRRSRRASAPAARSRGRDGRRG